MSLTGGQDLLSQFVLLQPVAKAQDGALVGQACEFFKLRKLAVQRGVKESFFHAGVRQGEPLLKEVRAQHGLQRERRTTLLAFGVVGRDEFDQCCPWHDFVHLLQELALAGFLHAQAQIKGCFFHESMMPGGSYVKHAKALVMQSFLSLALLH